MKRGAPDKTMQQRTTRKVSMSAQAWDQRGRGAANQRRIEGEEDRRSGLARWEMLRAFISTKGFGVRSKAPRKKKTNLKPTGA